MITEMPRWLRPTGGFGIGIQSAFMVTSKVVVKTQIENELMGRKITLTGPEKGGEITVEENNLGHVGTEVQIEVPVEKFMEWNRVVNEKNHNDEIVKYSRIEANELRRQDAFGIDYIKKYTQLVLKNYLEQIIPEPVIPIIILVNGFSPIKISAPTPEKITKCVIDGIPYLFWNEKNKDKGKVARIWDCKNNILVKVYTGPKHTVENGIYYKNVRMTEVTTATAVTTMVPTDDTPIRVDLDFMGLEAEKLLKIHRNGFAENFSVQDYKKRYIGVWTHFKLKDWLEKLEKEGIDDLPKKKSLLIQMQCVRKEDEEDFRNLLSGLCEKYPANYVLTGKKFYVKDRQRGISVPEDTDAGENTEQESQKSLNPPKEFGWKDKEWKLTEYYDDIYCPYLEGTESILIGAQKRKNKSEGVRAQLIYQECCMAVQNMLEFKNGKWQAKEKLSPEKMVSGKMNLEQIPILCKLLNEGVIYDDFLCEFYHLADKGQECWYSLEYGPNEKAMFVEEKRKLEEIKYCALDLFYKNSWEIRERDFLAAFPEEYKCLAVDEVPYTGEVEKRVIRPFPSSKIDEYEGRKVSAITMKKTMVSKEEFIKDLMGESFQHPSKYFGYLMRWVETHAAMSEVKEDRTIIWEKYREYIGGVYDANLKLNKGDET